MISKQKKTDYNEYKQLIINWYKENKRDLPWRNKGNPFDVFLSEFILQQTRIEQGTPYFLRIKTAFPTIEKLAQASEETILFFWQGLGYYSRARNLHASARMILKNYNGVIPDNFETLKKLKGIGDYTAAAIASIGYNQPVPLIDGNVFRVVSRIFGIETPIDTTQGKKEIRKALEQFFDYEKAGNFNEAMMDFGAIQCTPTNPKCNNCPFDKSCQAFLSKSVEKYPVKEKKVSIKTRYLNYLVLQTNESDPFYILSKRTDKDIWKNLYEFPLIETDTKIDDVQLKTTEFWSSTELFSTTPKFHQIIRKSHKLTHRLLQISFTIATIDSNFLTSKPPYLLLNYNEIQQKPLPIILVKFLNQINNV